MATDGEQSERSDHSRVQRRRYESDLERWEIEGKRLRNNQKERVVADIMLASNLGREDALRCYQVLQDYLFEAMCEGHAVVFPGIGSFFSRISKKPAKLTATGKLEITSQPVVVKFKPYGVLKSCLRGDVLKKEFFLYLSRHCIKNYSTVKSSKNT